MYSLKTIVKNTIIYLKFAESRVSVLARLQKKRVNYAKKNLRMWTMLTPENTFNIKWKVYTQLFRLHVYLKDMQVNKDVKS